MNCTRIIDIKRYAVYNNSTRTNEGIGKEDGKEK